MNSYVSYVAVVSDFFFNALFRHLLLIQMFFLNGNVIGIECHLVKGLLDH